MATFPELVASFDPDPGKRGRQFEAFVKWFLSNDPEWATQVEQVWLWEEYPDRWGVDCGIDLVFRHKNGETWAVQAKCYSHHHDITKHDVDKFLSESNRKGIDKRLLVATTDRIGANAKQVCAAQEKPVFRYLLSNFEAASIEYPTSLAALNTVRPKPRPHPKGHQVEAINAVASNFQSADRGQLIMACGTGKTFTTLWIKERLSATSTLILLPSLGLLSQTLHEWAMAANQPFAVLCVCSDDTVAKKGDDAAIHSVADVAFPVTSNLSEIQAFLVGPGAKVVFSTYQSSPLIAEAQAAATVPPFDLAIADEAHRCAGKVESSFSTILDSERIRATKRLFTTATPRTYSTSVKKAAGERGIEVVGMDDEAVFGKVLYALPFGEAIKRGLLTDYQVVIIGVDNPTIAAWIENRELLKTDTGIENDAESLAAQIGLLKAFKDYDLKRVISFHSRVKRAEVFAQDLHQVSEWIGQDHRPIGTFKADFVSGEMPTDRRRRKLAQLKAMEPGERGLLTNARCLSEGVDVPSLDGVAFIDPRSSQIDIIQAVGRAIRLSPDKKNGTIVLPVFIEDGDSPSESIEASNFKPIWDVLNALKAHDDVLSAEMDQLRTEMGRKPGSKVGAFSKVHIDLPSSVDGSLGEFLRTHLVEQVTASWDFWYGLLETYANRHGKARPIPVYKTPEGYKLGQWVRSQRQLYRANNLKDKYKEELEKLPGWSWEVYSDQWEQNFDELVNFLKSTGHARVPTGYVSETGARLGTWTRTQRRERSANKLDNKKMQRLSALPGWSWDLLDDQWENGFKKLEDYVLLFGNAKVKNSYVSNNNFKLGVWTSTQRLIKRKNKIGRLQIKRLEALPGWSWDPVEEQVEEGFGNLEEYVRTNGTARVPYSYIAPNGFKLGIWIQSRRHAKKKNTLEKVFIERLEAFPGWTWDPIDDQFKYGFEKLEQYVKSHGNARVSRSHLTPDGFKLGTWVGTLRELNKKGNLNILYKRQLESLEGWSWDPRGDSWSIGFEYLSKYVSTNGTAMAPEGFITADGFNLGGWLKSQRTARKVGRITEIRIKKLEKLPGWTWDVRVASWDEAIEHLKQYIKINGSSRVPQNYVSPDNFKLGTWVANQRNQSSKNDRLTKDRRNFLESLPGWVWKPFENDWDDNFKTLKKYVQEFGSALVPSSYIGSNGKKLGQWVSIQRQNQESLSEERKRKLKSLRGWVWKLRR